MRLNLTDPAGRDSRWPIIIATLRAAASWLFFRVADILRIGFRYARRSFLEKQPIDSRRRHYHMRDGALTLRKEQIAKWVSIGGHPFVFSPIVALLVGSFLFGPVESVIGLLTVILFCLLPASLYIVRKVRIGEWSDLDVSAKKDRPHLFLVGFAFLLLTALVLTVTGQPIIYARGCLAAMILIVGGWFLNRWLKPSMHAGFAMLTACSLWPLSARLSLVAILFAVVVGWSRVQLRRHTWWEVGVGLVLGLLVCRLILA